MKQTLIGRLAKLQEILYSLSLPPGTPVDRHRVRGVVNIDRLIQLIVANRLIQNVGAIQNTVQGLKNVTKALDEERANMQKTANNIKRASAGFGAVASLILFF